MADGIEGAFTGRGYNWSVPTPGDDWYVPRVDGEAARKRESGWSLLDPLYGGVSVAPLPDLVNLAGFPNYAVATTVGSNFTNTAASNVTGMTAVSGTTATTAGSNATFVSTASWGYSPPAPEPLEIRRFYHFNKSVTAGTADRPNQPHKQDVAAVSPIPDVVSEAREAIQVAESAPAQVVKAKVIQARENAGGRRQVRRLVLSPRSLTSLAVFLAGQKRITVGEEWRGHLLGEKASGLTQRAQARAARGFLLAAVRYRLQDAADLAWRPVDAVLGSRILSNLLVGGPVIVVLFAIVHYDGRFGLVADVQDPACLAAFLYGVIRTGRWWRGVKPQEPKPRRARE